MRRYINWTSVRITITCADVAGTLRALTEYGITLREVKIVDFMTAEIRCRKKECIVVKKLVSKMGGECRLVGNNIATTAGSVVKKRPILILGILLLLGIAAFLPTRILFVKVEGNDTIPSNKIIEAANGCGIRFGASRRSVRSEKVKNALLASMDDLQWAGINTSGCVATICVKEREAEKGSGTSFDAGHIVAASDGVIQSITIEDGIQLCKAGDAVVKGQTLISGYVDCGRVIKVGRACGEIQAFTIHEITAKSLTKGLARGGEIGEEEKLSLIIGKKLINFFKDSGISDTRCVKMYSVKYITLPGGLQLPIAFIRQRWITCDQQCVDMEYDHIRCLEYCRNYVLEHMRAGQIVNENVLTHANETNQTVTARYLCLENIGQFINEEIIRNDGQTD